MKKHIGNIKTTLLCRGTTDSAANKGCLIVNYRQSLAFDRPYLSCKDHCDRICLELLNIRNNFLFRTRE